MRLTFAARLIGRFQLWRSAWAVFVARQTGVRIAAGCELGARCDVRLGFAKPLRGAIEIGPGTSLARDAVLQPWGGSIRLGNHVYIGPGAIVYGHGGVDVGDDTLISLHCRILSSNHTIPPVGIGIRSQPDVLLPTRIGRDVWLGAGVTVLGGVTIGDGCVVGAGAVVTHDLPAYSVAFGVPARVTSQRPPTTRGAS